VRLKLKGNRKYITGADIINFYKYKLKEKKKITFNFYKLTRNYLVFKKNFEQKFDKSKLVCSISTSSNEKFNILEKNQKIHEKEKYDEKKFLINCKIKNQFIVSHNKGLNFFDNIVALNKELLTKIIGKYKWIFCKLEIKYLHNLNFNKIKITLINISNNFYSSTIQANNKNIGKIFFYKK
jgi:hypothetical protein